MQKYLFYGLYLGLLCWGWLYQPVAAQSTDAQTIPAATVRFDDSSVDTLQLVGRGYTLTLSKHNGALLGLTAGQSEKSLTLGSRDGCLWTVNFKRLNHSKRGGCAYAPETPDQFSYDWHAATTTLVMSYTTTTQSEPPSVIVTLAAADTFFDLQLTLTNGDDAVIDQVGLPGPLLIEETAVKQAYAPFLMPGLRLQPTFFAQDRSLLSTYPSDWAFADYLALDLVEGQLALYTVNPMPAPLQPVELGFTDAPLPAAATFDLAHTLYSWIEPGATWHSPPVRVRIGEPVVATIHAYRHDNGIDAYPSLAKKVGPRIDQLRRAPLLKADLNHLGKPFLELIPDLACLPAPALLHPVAFQPGGHDEYGPDYLPPDPRWGTLADFQAFVSAAQHQGLLVMPYINPTWWDANSPTLQQMAQLTLRDVAAQEIRNQPDEERYGARTGFTMSPVHPFVTARLASLMEEWQQSLPVDCIFEDQIGARAWQYDFNPAAPTPLVYSDGWLTHTQTYADRCLMTEAGWDRLAATEVGFHGTFLTWARTTDGVEQRLGTGNWAPYPLANWLYGDKVLFYQHDLASETMTADLGVLTWNLAFGNVLSYALISSDYGALDNPWLRVTGLLQHTIGVRTAGRLMDHYRERTPTVSESDFGDLTVIANWNAMLTYTVDDHRLAPGGFYAYASDQSVMAGVFVNRFNGNPLSAGEHYLLLERTPHRVTIRQPIGAQTVLLIDIPSAWQPKAPLHLWMIGEEGQILGAADFMLVDNQHVRFIYTPTWAGETVEHYELSAMR